MASGGSINTDILSDETFDLLCTMCKRKGKNSEARKYCVECQDYYCLICVNVHEDVPSLSGHKILDKRQFPSGSVKTRPGSSKHLPVAPTERCDRHAHHYIDMYCQNHNDVACGTCMAIDHRLCKDIFYIPEFLQNNTCTNTTREIQQKLDSVTKVLKEQQEKFKREKERLLKSKTVTLENIKKFRKEINDRLDELEKNTISYIEDKYKTFLNEMEESIRILETSKASLKSAREKLTLASDNKLQNFVNVKKGENIAENAAISVEASQLQTPFKDIDFTGDHRLASLLHEINVFGKIEQRIAMKTENIGTVNIHKNDSLLQVKGCTKCSVKVQSDKEYCNIVSACTLEDRTIILSDCNNNKLKRLDSSTYTVIDYCNLQGRPWQVCSIDKQQAAVCLHDKKEVQFISLSSKMTLTNKIKTDFECRGLSYADGNLYISDYTSVYIYSVSGRKLKQFSKDQSGQKLFSNILSLAVSEDGSKICVADYDNGLIILDNNGRVVGRFNDSQLKSAYGCCLTGRGSLLVCGNNSDNVLQFGPNGNLIGEVVKFDDTSAWHQAICCNQQMSKMIIGRNRDEIEVYDLI
ncbi:uncharacterized protein LOC128553040 [Mercenaria mercenaria]|uniref:uncharacterized protein LOC128553040 n=1 Tax=Mercenaria mercenaria TaxID=6596 RepID=UPI00234F930B|nr:uncharacterized protein LOC128553040 [Mercenaria mercenaria]